MTMSFREASTSKKPPINGWLGIGIVLVTMTISFFVAYARLLRNFLWISQPRTLAIGP